jgi:hypothetical protein
MGHQSFEFLLQLGITSDAIDVILQLLTDMKESFYFQSVKQVWLVTVGAYYRLPSILSPIHVVLE